jgi:hypothetical protein
MAVVERGGRSRRRASRGRGGRGRLAWADAPGRPDPRALALDALAAGDDPRRAADRAGIDEESLRDWLDDDPEFLADGACASPSAAERPAPASGRPARPHASAGGRNRPVEPSERSDAPKGGPTRRPGSSTALLAALATASGFAPTGPAPSRASRSAVEADHSDGNLGRGELPGNMARPSKGGSLIGPRAFEPRGRKVSHEIPRRHRRVQGH